MSAVKVIGKRIVLDSDLPIDAALTIAVNHEHNKVDVIGTTRNRNAERGMLFAALSKLEPDTQMSRDYKHLSEASLLLAKDEERFALRRY